MRLVGCIATSCLWLAGCVGSEAPAERVVAGVEELTSRAPLRQEPLRAQAGPLRLTRSRPFVEVLVVHQAQDGTVSARFVESADEARAFLAAPSEGSHRVSPRSER